MINYVTVILGMINERPDDQNIILRRLVTKLKLSYPGLNDQRPMHESLQDFLSVSRNLEYTSDDRNK